MDQSQCVPGRFAALAATFAISLAVISGGCGGVVRQSADPPAASGESAAYRDPGEVCAGFARDRFAHDTTVDAGPEAAHQRATVWLHPDLLAHQPPAGRHRQWRTWSRHHAAVELRVEPWAGDALPPDTEDTAYRAVLMATTPVGAHGWTGSTAWRTIYCALRPVDGIWLIADYHIDSSS